MIEEDAFKRLIINIFKKKRNIVPLLIKTINMKKLFTILIVVALTTTTSFAQAQFGSVTGLNMSAIGSSEKLETGEEWVGIIGIHIGGVAHIPLGDVMQLRTGLIYSQKGGKNTSTDFPYTSSATINLDYLEIPIEAAFVMGDRFALSVGPYIAFAMNKSAVIETNDPSAAGWIGLIQTIYDEAMDEGVSGVDFGLNFGASFTIAEHFLIGTKYSMGLTDIYNLPTDSPLYDPDEADDAWVNGCLSISFGYMFGGGY